MAGAKPTEATPALRLAVANLLRLAEVDVAGARLLLRRGQGRNAAVLAKQAIDRPAQTVAASEHGWRS